MVEVAGLCLIVVTSDVCAELVAYDSVVDSPVVPSCLVLGSSVDGMVDPSTVEAIVSCLDAIVDACSDTAFGKVDKIVDCSVVDITVVVCTFELISSEEVVA